MDYQIKASRSNNLLTFFDDLWGEIFTSPIHLDTALSKRAKNTKSILAQILPQILLQPASLAEAIGVGVPQGEPWNLTSEQLVKWRPAHLMAENLHRTMIEGKPQISPVKDDFPPVMLDEWASLPGFTDKDVLGLVRVLGSEAPLSLRVNRKSTPQEVLAKLTEGSRLPVSAMLSDISPQGIRLAGYAPVLNTELYESGAFEIQDEGSQILSYFTLWPEIFGDLLQKKPGKVQIPKVLPALPAQAPAWTIIDACAGAGGKTLAIADALAGKGRIYSYDTSERKLQALRRRAARAGATNVQAVAVVEGNEGHVVERFRKRANIVLVDAPCSGWGTIRRTPDIKWRQPLDVLERMPLIQERLLDAYSELVMSGGRLVFGVCTFRKAETVDVVESFLISHPDFTAAQGGYMGPGPTDGFFMQAFTRK